MKKTLSPILTGTVVGTFVYGILSFISYAIIADVGMGEKTGILYETFSEISKVILIPLVLFFNIRNPVSTLVGIFIIGGSIGALIGMTIKERRLKAKMLKMIINNIIVEANRLKTKYVSTTAPVNYACIFSQSETEFTELLEATKQFGKIIKETDKGPLFQITPFPTIVGNLQLLKIRKPDPTRPERGDADFTLKNYEEFKAAHLGQPGFTLIDKGTFEMIELMEPGADVRVYFSNPPLDKQLEL